MKHFIVTLLILLGTYMNTSNANAQNQDTAIFASGCFWCTESDFDKIYGVISTTSGYTGGNTENPTYQEVSHGTTGHYEALKIVFNPDKVSYETLLETFWKTHDPFDAIGQFCDKGDQYRAAIFTKDEVQQKLAETSKTATEKTLGKKVTTPILPASIFYDAESYHQDYHTKNPVRYKYYRWNCGRDKRTKEVWGK